MDLVVLAERLAVCRLPDDQPPPAPAQGATLWSLTRRRGETSLVCQEGDAPAGAIVEPGWRAMVVAGVLDFAMVGVLAGLTAVLADEGISVFVLSTYDTDVILVREVSLDAARSALVHAGHAVTDAE